MSKRSTEVIPTTQAEKLKRVLSIVNDTAGWQLAAGQLQQKLIDVLQTPDAPEPIVKKYEVAYLDGTYHILKRGKPDLSLSGYATFDDYLDAHDIASYLNKKEPF